MLLQKGHIQKFALPELFLWSGAREVVSVEVSPPHVRATAPWSHEVSGNPGAEVHVRYTYRGKRLYGLLFFIQFIEK